MEEHVMAHIYIYGDVQGVFFRRSAEIKAEELGVLGWIKNREDGNVETVCQGKKKDVNKFIAWCRKGPPLAKVKNVEVEWRKETEAFDGFRIN